MRLSVCDPGYTQSSPSPKGRGRRFEGTFLRDGDATTPMCRDRVCRGTEIHRGTFGSVLILLHPFLLRELDVSYAQCS